MCNVSCYLHVMGGQDGSSSVGYRGGEMTVSLWQCPMTGSGVLSLHDGRHKLAAGYSRRSHAATAQHILSRSPELNKLSRCTTTRSIVSLQSLCLVGNPNCSPPAAGNLHQPV